MQPGDALTLFDGRGGEWAAQVTRMGKRDVDVRVGSHDPIEREADVAVTLVAGMPANDRFDWLVEKATELGANAIEPVVCARSVLRLSGERAERKREHWQHVAIAAAEQCGRTRVPRIAPIQPLERGAIGAHSAASNTLSLLLSTGDAVPLHERLAGLNGLTAGGARDRPTAVRLHSGPEGGFTAEEETALTAAGALPTSLGRRILRAETAPLAALALITLGR
jgi:16S rRNA (uracil1498-N3)-methyltransferase